MIILLFVYQTRHRRHVTPAPVITPRLCQRTVQMNMATYVGHRTTAMQPTARIVIWEGLPAHCECVTTVSKTVTRTVIIGLNQIGLNGRLIQRQQRAIGLFARREHRINVNQL